MYCDFLVLCALLLLPGLASSYVASLMCRFAHWRRHHVHWWFGLLSAGFAYALVICFVQLGSSLQHGEDSYGVIRWLCLVVCPAASFFAVVPAELVVWRYRKAYGILEHAP